MGSTDQVKVILRGLGAQTDGDLSFISSDNAVRYVRDLEKPDSRLDDGFEVEFAQKKFEYFSELLGPHYSSIVDLMQ